MGLKSSLARISERRLGKKEMRGGQGGILRKEKERKTKRFEVNKRGSIHRRPGRVGREGGHVRLGRQSNGLKGGQVLLPPGSARPTSEEKKKSSSDNDRTKVNVVKGRLLSQRFQAEFG